jgi:outer membrane protein assembly factor BamD (BamD/ComL family)
MLIMARSRCSGSRTIAGLAAAVCAFVSCAALAQQEYILTEEDRWATTQPVDPTTPAGQLNEARRALAMNEPQRAEMLASAWIERHERDPLLPEAYLIRGDAKAANGDEYKALFDYEYIARMFAGSDVFVAALQRELAIAKEYLAGKRRKNWGLRIWDAKADAEEILIRVQERLPGSRLAEDAGITLADYYFDKRDMELAAEAYDVFLENYPRSALVDKARRRLIYAQLATFKGPQFSAKGLYEARERLRQLRANLPAEAERMGAGALLTRIDESDAQKMLSIANYYIATGEPVSAEFTIRRLVNRYPRSVATAEALRIVPGVIERLPERVRRTTPDYAAMAAALLDDAGRTQPQAPPAVRTEPASATEPASTVPPGGGGS